MKEWLNPYPGGPLLAVVITIMRYLRGRKAPSEAGVPQKAVQSSEIAVSTVRDIPKGSMLLDQIFSGRHKFKGVDVFVHGSWADDTRTAFSDLDDFILIDHSAYDRESARRLVRWLNRVDMRMCRIDPLQHHGHWIAYMEDIGEYDAATMPPAALRGAICLHGNPVIRFRVSKDKSQVGYCRVLSGLLQNVEQFSEEYFQGTINLYDMKSFISSILLMPALVMQIRGDDIDKRSAILSVDSVFPPDACSVVAACSAIRGSWGAQLQTNKFTFLRAASHLFLNPHLFRKFSARFSPRYVQTGAGIRRGDLDVLTRYIRLVLSEVSC